MSTTASEVTSGDNDSTRVRKRVKKSHDEALLKGYKKAVEGYSWVEDDFEYYASEGKVKCKLCRSSIVCAVVTSQNGEISEYRSQSQNIKIHIQSKAHTNRVKQ
jgi:hypothetical protein